MNVENVTCVGRDTCQDSIFCDVEHLNCLGADSCTDSFYYEGSDDVPSASSSFLCSDGNDCSGLRLSNFDSVVCLSEHSCNGTIFSNIEYVICRDSYSCEDATFNSVTEIVCDDSFSCQRSTFNDIGYKSVTCMSLDSCAWSKGEIYECDDIESESAIEFVCEFGQICGYTCTRCTKCYAFCYGDCFCAGEECELSFYGVASPLIETFAFDNICVEWYYYYIFLLPSIIFWAVFTSYYEFIHEKLDSVLVIFELKTDYTSKSMKQTLSKVETMLKTAESKNQADLDLDRTDIYTQGLSEENELAELVEISHADILSSEKEFHNEIENVIKPMVHEMYNVWIPMFVWDIIFRDYLYQRIDDKELPSLDFPRASSYVNIHIYLLFCIPLLFRLVEFMCINAVLACVQYAVLKSAHAQNSVMIIIFTHKYSHC